jgi:carbonic anhydrase/acetyltransferase-like protein (isoleucine patch superfamily)
MVPPSVAFVRSGSACYTAAVIVSFRGKTPRLAASTFVVDSAVIVGDVELGAEASVWFHAVVRGDVERIRIGARTNIQDNATVHVTHDRWPTILGTGVTIAHNVVVHGCTIGDHSLIGIGAIVLDGVEIGAECLVGAGALVSPRTRIPPRSLVLGSPAMRVRELRPEEIARVHEAADNYVRYACEYRAANVG